MRSGKSDLKDLVTKNTGKHFSDLRADLERCNRELERLRLEAETELDTDGVLMGLRDWQYEKRLIEAELLASVQT